MSAGRHPRIGIPWSGGGGGGPDVWYYTAGWAENTEEDGEAEWANHLYIYGGTISIAQSGTVTAISAKVRNTTNNALTFKFALYNSAGELIANGTEDMGSTETALEWHDVSVSATVTAGDYSVFVSSSTALSAKGYLNNGSGDSAEVAYANFPPATLPSLGSETVEFGMRVYVD